MKIDILNVNGKIDHTIEYQEVAGIKFQTNGRVIQKRIKRFYSKEPKTIEWMLVQILDSTLCTPQKKEYLCMHSSRRP